MSWRDRFILRCGYTAKDAGRAEPVVASVVGTAWAIAERLLPMGHKPALNDN